MQKQVRTQLAREKLRGKKYNNEPTEVANIRFDSKKEAERYNLLATMQKAGEIEDLKLQRVFTLQEQFKTPDGELVRAIKYVADFTYIQDGKLIIEDVKSAATRKDKVYSLKKRMMAEKGFKIREV